MELTQEERRAFAAFTEMLDAQGIKYENAVGHPLLNTPYWHFIASVPYGLGRQVVCQKYCDVSKTPYVFRDEL